MLLFVASFFFFFNKNVSLADGVIFCVCVCGDGGLVAKLCPILATPWTVVCQAALSMGFSRQEYWSGLPFPSPGDLSDSGIKTRLQHH